MSKKNEACQKDDLENTKKDANRKKRSRIESDDSQNSPKFQKKITRSRTVKELFEPLGDGSNIQNSYTVTGSTCTSDGDQSVEIAQKEESVNEKIDIKPPPPAVNDNITIDSTSYQIHSKRGPTPRWGHTFCLIQDDKALVVGGQNDKLQMCRDSSWIFDIVGKRWTNPATSFEGQNPELRMGHSATYDPTVRCVYIYGGSKNKRWFNDVHILDLDDFKWQLVKTQGKAPTRAYHSTTLYRHELWVFGGIFPRPDPQPDGSSNEIHIYSPLTESWYTPLLTGSERPAPVSGHSATLMNDRLLVFGGWDFPYCFNDIYILDMSIVEWIKPKVNGTPPTPRSWHSASHLRGNRILIHGGYNGDVALSDTSIFNLDSLTWYNVNFTPPMLSRAGLATICPPYRHENGKNDEVIVFGGGDNDGSYFNDLVEIHVPFAVRQDCVTDEHMQLSDDVMIS